MKQISTTGWTYIVYSLMFCGYFSTASLSGWRAPDFSAGGGSSSGGSYYGRSSGGSWGGGK